MLAKVQQPRLQDKGALIGDVTSNCGMGRDVHLKTDRTVSYGKGQLSL